MVHELTCLPYDNDNGHSPLYSQQYYRGLNIIPATPAMQVVNSLLDRPMKIRLGLTNFMHAGYF